MTVGAILPICPRRTRRRGGYSETVIVPSDFPMNGLNLIAKVAPGATGPFAGQPRLEDVRVPSRVVPQIGYELKDLRGRSGDRRAALRGDHVPSTLQGVAIGSV
jgi:hypothetical protein